MSADKRHPLILWAQRDNVLFLTIEIEDAKVEKLVFEGSKFFISATNGSGKENYEADLELYGPVKGTERRQIATARHIELVVPKETDEWWPRLLKKSIKVPWLKVDFNKWVDEDEVAEEQSFDFNSMNFPGGSDMFGGGGFGGLGDAGLGEDDEDSEDEDEAALPKLDDVKPDSEKPEDPVGSATA
ncbi:CS domain and HSP20-like chaperone domain-containing protein [Aphelenchoides bicaudatus]|nr:CS domain and HSP20-like chaperone domain-containing protein [Aphelenchoides bicaudatus]